MRERERKPTGAVKRKGGGNGYLGSRLLLSLSLSDAIYGTDLALALEISVDGFGLSPPEFS